MVVFLAVPLTHESLFMIPYDPKSWLRLSFAYKGTIIPRVIGRVGVLMALAVVVFVGREAFVWLTTPPKDAPAVTRNLMTR